MNGDAAWQIFELVNVFVNNLWCQGLNINLVFVTFVIVLGSSFQFGYNISVLNQPTKVCYRHTDSLNCISLMTCFILWIVYCLEFSVRGCQCRLSYHIFNAFSLTAPLTKFKLYRVQCIGRFIYFYKGLTRMHLIEAMVVIIGKHECYDALTCCLLFVVTLLWCCSWSKTSTTRRTAVAMATSRHRRWHWLGRWQLHFSFLGAWSVHS